LARRSRLFLAGLAASAAVAFAANATSDERTISFYHIHTKETLTVTYKRDGTFIPEALKKINWLMRDWRMNEEIEMDPSAIDIVWEMHRELGSKEPVHVICGYRSKGTNDMLRRTAGGQASNSQHISGKAIDIAFPDVPARQLRYSAMIRERGGVGYYPTSAIAFVHVDTGRVRHWPRMGRDELALLFPSGRSRYEPSDGRPIAPADVVRARQRAPDTAREVTAFFDLRNRQRAPILVADASGRVPQARSLDQGAEVEQAPRLEAPQPKPAVRPAKSPAEGTDKTIAVAALEPVKIEKAREPAPKLIAAPQLVERSSRFTLEPSEKDRAGLDTLVAEAQRNPPKLVKAPGLVQRPPKKPDGKSALPVAVAAHAPGLGGRAAGSGAARAGPALSRELDTKEAWAQAPAFDDDHPEELFYRPFPLAPLLTASNAGDDPALTRLVAPDVGKTLDMLDDVGSVLPMRFRPGQQTAELIWSKEFRGQAVSIAELAAGVPPPPAPQPALNRRLVRTSQR